MSEIENGKLGLHGTEHSKCNQLVILGWVRCNCPTPLRFKGSRYNNDML